MKINKYEDISQIDREAKKDYIDRHSAFVHCEKSANCCEKFKVKVKVGDEYAHPDVPDHYIAYVQLWNGEKMLAQASFIEGALGNEPNNQEEYLINGIENRIEQIIANLLDNSISFSDNNKKF